MKLNFYMTCDSVETIRQNFTNIYKNSEIIDVRAIIEREKLYFFKYSKFWNRYILFIRINKLIQNHIRRRKNIIYIVKKLNNTNVSEIKKYLNKKNPLLLYNFCLIDFNDKVDRNLYSEFDILL